MDYTPEFRETLDLIYSFTMNGRKNRKILGEKTPPSLDTMNALMDFFGNPDKNYPVIHVAGTKGKGSTANFIANTLRCSGYKVGLYTSPHLQDFSERIQINGKLIPHQEVSEIVGRMVDFFESHEEVNTFEVITATAFEYFRREKIDIAVIEVGLGGRFDSTNVVEPMLSVITSISYDHMDLLGDTLELIAFEKAGIIKPNIPVVIGFQTEEAKKVLLDVAEERNSPVIDAQYRWSTGEIDTVQGKHSFAIGNDSANYVEVTIPLLGLHQIENATLAFAAMMQCRSMGWKISDQAIQTGFSTVHWPARFEVLSEQPLVVIDGAHNVDSVQRLLETVNLVYPGKKIQLLVGMSTGKDLQGMLEELLPICTTCLFTRSTHPKALEPSKLVQLSNELGYETNFEMTVEKALEKALTTLPNDTLLLCTGSLYAAAAVKSVWNDITAKMKD